MRLPGAVLPSLAALQLLALLLGIALPTRAAELDWQAPPPCPDSDEVRFRVERAIGMPLSHAAALRFIVHARRAERGYEASIDVQDARARRRTLSAAACPELVDMVTVTVALALGVDGSLPPDEPAPASVQTSASSAPPPPTVSAPAAAALPGAADTASSPREHAGAAWSPGLALWLLADSGSLPQPGGGAALEARIEHRWLQLRASGSWYLPQHVDLSGVSTPAPGADLGLLTGALALCAVPLATPAWRGSVCAGWELGRLWGEGTRVQRPRQGSALWSAPQLEAGVSLALGHTPLRLAALFALALPLARENFVLGELGAVHRPPALVGRAGLGLEWTLR